MPNSTEVKVYYHDRIEVERSTSWTGLCPSLDNAELVDIPQVAELFGYARPDAVVTVNGRPVLSIEQTQMNPSGHNIPQRFSCQVRAAELGVPSILYYPERARRTFSDPNLRNLQVRVPLAQKRLSELYDVPALSVFWPTDPKTNLPDTIQAAHEGMAKVVDALVLSSDNKDQLLSHPAVQSALSEMNRAVSQYSISSEYPPNPSVRRFLPRGFPTSVARTGISVDPPMKAQLARTADFTKSVRGSSSATASSWSEIETRLRARDLTLVFTGTANSKRNDSEHPWPGYLTLLDILYLRNGPNTSDRLANLVYVLPVGVSTFMSRLNKPRPPRQSFIVDSFADLIVLNGGVVPGRPLRGSAPATVVLSGQ